MKISGGSWFWRLLYRTRLARAPMPFWRVVLEAKLDRRAKRWPKECEAAVTAVFVWARTVEEAEGLAALAVERDGLIVITADAKKCAPAAAPSKAPIAVSRTVLGFLQYLESQAGANGPSRRDARA